MNECESCEITGINGVLRIHEHGCPDAWKDKALQCHNCEAEFKPERDRQMFCSWECRTDYYPS